MGEIVFWSLFRIVITIPLLWFFKGFLDFSLWWIIVAFALYGIIVHPGIIGYRKFEERNKILLDSSLCSGCRHFDKSAVICIKHDDHPTLEYLPCDGKDWEPKSFENNN